MATNDTGHDLVRYTFNGSAAEVATADPDLLHASSIVDKVISPILYVLGFPGNILSIIIWLQPRMRHSSGTYLAALGFADLLFLVIHVLFELYKVWNVNIFNFSGICELLPSVFMATQYLSPLLVLGFTVERFIGVWFPMRRDTFCTQRRAIAVITGLVVFSIAMASMQAYIYQFHKTAGYCGLRDAAVAGGHASLWSVWTWITEMTVFMAVPLSILIFNIFIIMEVKRLSDFESCFSSRSHTTTFSLLVVSFYFIITTLPVSIVYATRYYFISTDEVQNQNSPSMAQYMLVKTIIEEIGITHYACKFYIFLITEKVFREELVAFLMKIASYVMKINQGYMIQPNTTVQTDYNESEMTHTVLEPLTTSKI